MAYLGMSKKELDKARDKRGGSNVGEYSAKATFAGPSGGAPKGSYPITKDGKLNEGRVKSAIKLAHNAPNPTGLKRFIGNKLIKSGDSKMKSLGGRILDKLLAGKKKKKEADFGGNKGDISRSAPKDYKNFKDTDPDYKSKRYGGGHGAQRRSARRDYSRRK